jgi:hypothetical protein
MIKRYVLLIAMIVTILVFTSTSTASFLFSKGKMYENLPKNLPLYTILDRLSQVISDNNDIELNDVQDNDDEDDDLVNSDGPLEDVLLPETIDIDGEITPYEGNYIEINESEETATIDSDEEVGLTQGEWTIDSAEDKGTASHETTIAEAEWTVDYDGEGGTLKRVVEIVTEVNGNLGARLERVIAHTTSSSDSVGTTEVPITAEIVVVPD